jgi:hypothetical protein
VTGASGTLNRVAPSRSTIIAKRKNDIDKRKQPNKGNKPLSSHPRKRSKEEEEKELKALYAKMRKKFTAADLEKHTEIEEGIPFEQVIAEMKAIQRGHERKFSVPG